MTNSNSVNESAAGPVKLPRVAKGRRPYFFEDPAVDQLMSIVTALAGEVAVLRERSDAVERLLEQAGHLDRNNINQFLPDADTQTERDAWRESFLTRIFRVIEVERANLRDQDTPDAYSQTVRRVSDS